MRGKWMHRVRRIHTWLGVFFSPLLLLFVITGWWQTFVSEDDKDKGSFNAAMSKFSSIHTDDYFARTPGDHHASHHFQILVGCMAAALIFTIVLGLMLAFQPGRKKGLTALAFGLGILVPAVILYFS
jgi:hypothetical protein